MAYGGCQRFLGAVLLERVRREKDDVHMAERLTAAKLVRIIGRGALHRATGGLNFPIRGDLTMRSTFGTLVVTFPLVMLQWMPRAVAQDAVTLWTGNATYTQIAHLRDADTTVDWTRTATVTFDVDSTRNIKRDTLVMFHSLNGVWRERGQEIMSLHHLGYPGAEARSVLPKEIEYNQPAAMSVKTCEPALSATSGLPENTFHLGLVATPQVQLV